MKWADSRTLLATVVAIALIATGAYFGAVRAAAGEPQLAAAQNTWGDGLNHFVVSARNGANGPLSGGTPGRDAATVLAVGLASQSGIMAAKPLGGGLVAITTSRTETEVRALPEISFAVPDVLVQPASIYDGRPWELEYHDPDEVNPYVNDLTAIRAQDAWDRSTGVGAVIAVVDTGVFLEHMDVRARLWRNTFDACGDNVDNDANGYTDDCVGWDMGDNDNNPRPRQIGPGDSGIAFQMREHGTGVAGVAAGTPDNDQSGIGVAPHATIMPVKVSTGLLMPLSSIVAGTLYAIDNGADIVTAAYTLPKDSPAIAKDVLAAVATYAKERDVLIVAAAGNDGLDADKTEILPAALSKTFDNVISVGGSTVAPFKRASFSNYGKSVDIAAPGKAFAAVGMVAGWSYFEGTSFSAAYVAGGAAVAASRHPSMTAADLKRTLMKTAHRYSGLSSLTSTGMMDVSNALGKNDDMLTATWRGLEAVNAGEQFSASIDIDLKDREKLSEDETQLRITAVSTEQYSAFAVGNLALKGAFNGASFDVVTQNNGVAVFDSALTLSDLSALRNGAAIELSGAVPEGRYGFMVQVTYFDGTAATNGVASYFWSYQKPSTPAPPPWSSGNSSGSTGSSTTIPGGKKPSTVDPSLPPPDPSPEFPEWDGPVHMAPKPSTTTTTQLTGSPGTVDDSPLGAIGGKPATSDTGRELESAHEEGAAPPVSPVSETPSQSVPPPTTTSSIPTTTTATPMGSGKQPTKNAAKASSGSASANANSSVAPTTTPPSIVLPQPVLPPSEDGWQVAGITPRSGLLAGGTLVKIDGVFPKHTQAAVYVDGVKSTIVSANPIALTAITPAHAAGTVTVTVTGPGGVSLDVINGFTYLASQPKPSVSSTTTQPSNTPGDSTIPPISWDPPSSRPGQPRVVQRGSLTLYELLPASNFTKRSAGDNMMTLRCSEGQCPSFSVPK
jgi:hypothetical protein